MVWVSVQIPFSALCLFICVPSHPMPQCLEVVCHHFPSQHYSSYISCPPVIPSQATVARVGLHMLVCMAMFWQWGGYREWFLWQAGRSFPHVLLRQPVLLVKAEPITNGGCASGIFSVFKKQGEGVFLLLVWNIWPPGFSLSPPLSPPLLSPSPWHLNTSESFINLPK